MKVVIVIFLMSFLSSCKKSSPQTDAVEAGSLPAKYELILNDQIITEEYSEDLKGWLKSLYTGLGYNNTDTEEEVFLRCNLKVKSSGSSYLVFQSTKNSKRFYVQDLGYVIDFQSREIGTLGVGGMSSHSPASKRMVVLLSPSKGQRFMGVLLGDLKTDTGKPKFDRNRVCF